MWKNIIAVFGVICTAVACVDSYTVMVMMMTMTSTIMMMTSTKMVMTMMIAMMIMISDDNDNCPDLGVIPRTHRDRQTGRQAD